MKPEQEKHETVFQVEPLSGLPLSVIARFQVNMRLVRLAHVRLFEF